MENIILDLQSQGQTESTSDQTGSTSALDDFQQALRASRTLQKDRQAHGYNRVAQYFEGGDASIEGDWLECWQEDYD